LGDIGVVDKVKGTIKQGVGITAFLSPVLYLVQQWVKPCGCYIGVMGEVKGGVEQTQSLQLVHC
jgi:hypothetical protein